jgi:hypothetical protein
MGEFRHHSPVLLLLGAFSRYPAALAWAREQSCRVWGPVALASEEFAFDNTQFYEPTMGAGLRKVFWAFERLVAPEFLVEAKCQTDAWEREYCHIGGVPEPRPVNLDPGYLTEAKLVLATTKDRDHRLYLGRGVFAEVTLYYQRGGGWQAREWTYPDYRRPACHTFFLRCRAYLRQKKP